MTDISSTGILKNKMRILYCSSSTCPNRESVSESFILHNSWAVNLGNKSNTQLCPQACQTVVFLTGRSAYQAGRNHLPDPLQKSYPFSWTWAATLTIFRSKTRHWLVFWPLPFRGSKNCGYHHERFWKGWHQAIFEDYVQSYFGFENTKLSHHTFHFTWPEMLSSDS